MVVLCQHRSESDVEIGEARLPREVGRRGGYVSSVMDALVRDFDGVHGSSCRVSSARRRSLRRSLRRLGLRGQLSYIELRGSSWS